MFKFKNILLKRNKNVSLYEDAYVEDLKIQIANLKAEVNRLKELTKLKNINKDDMLTFDTLYAKLEQRKAEIGYLQRRSCNQKKRINTLQEINKAYKNKMKKLRYTRNKYRNEVHRLTDQY